MSTETQTAQLWICTSCGFVYDPDEGDPDGGIPPGTPFDQIPDDWFCPVCGARKADFEPFEDYVSPFRASAASSERSRCHLRSERAASQASRASRATGPATAAVTRS